MDQEQQFISQLRFRLVDVVKRMGSGRAFNHSGNPSLYVIVWVEGWEQELWPANRWAFSQGLFRGREFFVSRETITPVDTSDWMYAREFRIADGLSLANVFASQYQPGTSQLDPVLAAEDAAKWEEKAKRRLEQLAELSR
jgi:hypothetical protein